MAAIDKPENKPADAPGFFELLLGLRRTNEALAVDRRFREMIEALPAAIYVTDAEGRITYFNDAAATLWGQRPTLGEHQWCGSWKLYWPDGAPMAHNECPMAQTLKTGEAVRGAEAIAERPDGSRIWFTPYPTPLHDAEGTLIGAINMLVDITERKRGEEAGLRLAAIVESSDDAIVSKNLDGTITSWNRAAERLFGYAAQEAVGQSIYMIIPPHLREEERGILERLRRGERIDHFETLRRRKDGSLINISLTVSPLKNADGIVVGASKIGRDITERRRAEERQALLIRELHHRTKNMFAVVQSIVSRGLEGGRPVEVARELVLGRLRALAQTHARLDETGWGGADLADVVRAELRPFAGAVDIAGPPMTLSAQGAQNFALVIHELATNAAKHGALSAPTGRVSIRWSIDGTGSNARFSFRWVERGGPKVTPPAYRGFGTTVLERLVRDDSESTPTIEFASDGLSYELHVAVDAIAARSWHPSPETTEAPLS
jgi:two-component system, chemotaxis family, CheB/CheR fusion protein